MRTALVLSLALSLGGCAMRGIFTPVSLPTGGRELHDLAYVDEGAATPDKHRLNLYVPPPGDAPRPVLVFVHGGGWVLGDRNMPFDDYGKLGRRFANRGFLTAIISYRLAPRAKYPAQVQDVAAALRWMRDHAANYGGDPHRLFAMGHSAGGQLVALVGTDPKWLAAQGMSPADLSGVIALSGPYDVQRLGRSLFVGGPIVLPTFGRDHAVWADATPATHLGEGHPPPFFVSYADGDFPMLRDYARTFARQLAGAHVPVVLREVTVADHFSEIANLGESGDGLAQEIESFTHDRSGLGAGGLQTSAR